MTYKIATEDDAKNKSGSTATIVTNRCCTYTNAISIGCSVSGTYTANLLVIKDDLSVGTVSITGFTITVDAGSISVPSTIGAEGGTLTISNLLSGTYIIKAIYSDSTEVDITSTYTTYGTLTSSYSWSVVGLASSYARVENSTSTTNTITINSRGLTYSTDTRECPIVRWYSVTFTPNDTSISSITKTAMATCSVQLDENIIESVKIILGSTVTYSELPYNAYTLGTTATPDLSSYSYNIVFSSQAETMVTETDSTYGSLALSRTFSTTYSFIQVSPITGLVRATSDNSNSLDRVAYVHIVTTATFRLVSDYGSDVLTNTNETNAAVILHAIGL